jgi:integrase/recombinase XerD
VTTRREAPDGFYRHLREWFTAFLPRQRGAAGNTITSCRHTWNMLLGHAAGHHRVAVEKVTFTMLDRATVTGFLDHMQAARSWTASTRNQRLACIRSFFTYAAAAEPALAIYLADLAGIPRLNGPAAAPVKYMTTDAVTALLAAPDPGTRLGLRDQFFMILMYDLAARDAEMLALNLADIDTRRRLTADLIGKGSKPRRLPITSQTARHFGRYAAVFHPSPEPAAPMFYTVRNHRPAPMSALSASGSGPPRPPRRSPPCRTWCARRSARATTPQTRPRWLPRSACSARRSWPGPARPPPAPGC